MKINVSTLHQELGEPYSFMFKVQLSDLHTVTKEHAIPVAIAEGVMSYIKEQQAAAIYEAVKAAAQEQINQAVAEYLKKESVAIMKSLDLEGIAKIAALHAAKELGKEVAK